MSNETNTIIKEKGQYLFIETIRELKGEPYSFSTEDFYQLLLSAFPELSISIIQDAKPNIE